MEINYGTTIKSICTSVLFILSFTALYATDIEEGSVSGTWDMSGSPYVVHGDIDIPAGSILEIEPGVEIYFDNFASLTVAGTLLAFGTEDGIITFSPTNEQLGWEGIKVNATASEAPTMFDYCSFEKSSAVHGGVVYIGYMAEANFANCNFESNSATFGGGAIYSDNESTVKIVNSRFNDNYAAGYGGAVALWPNCSAVITGNDFLYNEATHGGALFMRGTGDEDVHILVKNNSFKCNKAQYGSLNIHPHGGAIFAYGAYVTIENNVLMANSSVKSGGGIYAESCSGIEIINNDISSNSVTLIGTGGGIEIMKRTKGIIMGNLVYDNMSPYCAGISLEECDMNIINNTISNNSAEEHGGGLSFLGSSYEADFNMVYNNIIWGNEPDQIFADGYFESLLIDNCDLQGGIENISGNLEYVTIVSGENNIDQDPQFIDAPGSSYTIGLSSPCVDAGFDGLEGIEFPQNDVLGNPRIHNNTIDIGACEYFPSSIQTEKSICRANTLKLSNSPNPFNPVTNITYDLPEAAYCKLTVYNVKGQLITTLIDAPQSAGPHTITWDGKDSSGRGAASGIYLYRLEAGDSVVTRKMVVVK